MSRLNSIDNNNLYNHYNHRTETTSSSSSSEEIAPVRSRKRNLDTGGDIGPTSRVRTDNAVYRPTPDQIRVQAINREPDVNVAIRNALMLFNKGKAIINQQLKEITKEDELILFVGNTGVGKSTLINYLSGCNLHARLDGLSWVIDVKNPIVEIGNSQTRSATSIPKLYRDVNNYSVYCDLPGFNDSRGLKHKLANACLIKEVASKAKGIKIILVASLDSLRSTEGRTANFRSCIDQINQLITTQNTPNAISLIVTKAESDTDLEGIQGLLGEITDNDAVLKNTVKIIGNKIAFFREPQKKGMIKNHDKDLIIEQIKHNKVIRGTDLNLSVPISEEMTASIINIGTEINHQIGKLSKKLGFELRELVAENNKTKLPDLYRGLKTLTLGKIQNFASKIKTLSSDISVLTSPSVLRKITSSVKEIKFLNMISNKKLEKTDIWLEGLRKVCNDISHSFNGDSLTIKGKYILTSQVAKLLNNTPQFISKINIYSTCSVIGDQSLKFPSGNVEIISPSCSRFYVNLSGSKGPDHDEISAATGGIVDKNGRKGRPGLPGMSGGNIVVILHNTDNYPSANVDGGEGGKGQDGGKGAVGKNGTDANQPGEFWIRNIFTKKDFFPSQPSNSKVITRKINGDTKDYEIVFYGTKGTNGGDGGIGGRGGLGGLSGLGIVLSLNNREIKTLANKYDEYTGEKGTIGDNGEPGEGGEGGNYGRNVRCSIDVNYITDDRNRLVVDSDNVCIDYEDHDPSQAPDGKQASYNTQNIKGRREPRLIRMQTPDIWSYINYLEDYIANNPKDRNHRAQVEFLGLLKQNNSDLRNTIEKARGY